MQKNTLKQMLAMCDEIRSMSFQVDESERALVQQKERLAALTGHIADTATLVTATQTKGKELDEKIAQLKAQISTR